MAVQLDRGDLKRDDDPGSMSFRTKWHAKTGQIEVKGQDTKTRKKYSGKFNQDKLVRQCGFPPGLEIASIHETLKRAFSGNDRSLTVEIERPRMNEGVGDGGDGMKTGMGMNVLINQNTGVFIMNYTLYLSPIQQSAVDILGDRVKSLEQENLSLKSQINVISDEKREMTEELEELQRQFDGNSDQIRQLSTQIGHVVERMSGQASTIETLQRAQRSLAQQNQAQKRQIEGISKENERMRAIIQQQGLSVRAIKAQMTMDLEDGDDIDEKGGVLQSPGEETPLDEEGGDEGVVHQDRSIIVRRGVIRKTKSWFFTSNQTDAITLRTDKRIKLVAIGIFVGNGRTTCRVNVYRGHNGRGTRPIYRGSKQDYEAGSENSVPFRHDLGPNGIVLDRDQLYTIETNQKGPGTFSVERCESSITENGITFRFGRAQYSPNGTTPNNGQLPCLFFEQMGRGGGTLAH